MTKIDIISGFLGAGKTTLIKKLIEEAFTGEKLVLIENEFGEIGIDGGFLKDSGINITEMNSGCICCSLVGDFGTALAEVLEKYAPDRIIIEPSGVGKLSDVIKAVLGVKEKVAEDSVVLNSFTTVADAGRTCGNHRTQSYRQYERRQITGVHRPDPYPECRGINYYDSMGSNQRKTDSGCDGKEKRSCERTA